MTVITTIAFVLVGLGAVATLARLLLGPTLADRVVATDLLLTLLSSAAAVHAVRTGDGIYLEVMLVVAVVGFLGTAAVARFIERQVP
jgi:multicomponent Na+:H+ antiporter subunit F